jgi:hypothetical protein
MTLTQIRDLFSRNLSANRIERALTTLATHNFATIARAATNGRPVEIWRACSTTETINTTKGVPHHRSKGLWSFKSFMSS